MKRTTERAPRAAIATLALIGLTALATLGGQLLASLLAERIGIVVVFSGVGLMFAAAGLLALALLPSRLGTQPESTRDAGAADWQVA